MRPRPLGIPALLSLAGLILACSGGPEPDGPAGSGGEGAVDLDALVFQAGPTTLPSGGDGQVPSLQPGQVQPPPVGGSGEGLKVIGVGPIDRVDTAQQVVVQFDRKMVALSDLDTMSASVPLRCEGLSGQARWAGTSTAIITATEPWPMATAFSCAVPAGTAALDGSALEQEVRWSFETGRPAVVRMLPYDGVRQFGLDDSLLVSFDQPVDPQAVAPFLRLTGDGRAVPFTVERRDDDSERDVRVVAELAPDVGYRFEVSPGVVGLEGPLPSESGRASSFRTYPPLALEEVGPEGEADPYTVLYARFTTDVQVDEVADHLSISPEPPDPFEVGGGWSTERWRHGIRLEPRTEYTVTLAPGLSDVHGQTLAEGATWRFTTGDHEPMLDVAQGTLIYPATNPPELPMRVRNLESVQASVVAITPEDWRGYSDHGRGLDALFAAAPRVTLAPGAEVNRVGIEKLDLREHLRDGYGLLAIETSTPQRTNSEGVPYKERLLLQVTDLGVQLKLGPNGTTAWVTRLSDGQPAPGASVRVLLPGGASHTATADAMGVARFPDGILPAGWRSWDDEVWVEARLGDDVALVNHEWRAGPGPWRFGIYSSFDSDGRQVRTYGFLDRGVYKLGDPVHARVTLRGLDIDGLDIPSGSVTWTLKDDNGAEVRSGEGRLDDRGGFSVSTELPGEGALGYWSLQLRVDSPEHGELSHYESIPVKAYRAPSFRVDLDAPEQSRPGQLAAATVNGRYLFGAPMPDAEVRWNVFQGETRHTPEGWDGFAFAPRWEGPWWRDYYEESPEVIASGDGRLDGDGQLPITAQIPATDDGVARRVTVEAQVTDPARQVVAGSAEVLVHPADYYAGVRPSTGFTPAGQPVDIQAVAVSPDGEAAARAVEISVSRRTWDRVREKGMDGTWSWVSTEKDELVASQTVQTRAGDQPASFRFTPEQAGYYVIDAKTFDDAGRVASAGSSLYAWGGDASWARGDDNMLELVPDKSTYAPGDTARVLIKAPVAGLKALVTTEREGVLSRQVITLSSTASTVEIPLTEREVPNVFVSVVAVEGAPPVTSPDGGMPQLHVGYVELDVTAEGRRLAVAVDTDRDSYQPRDEVAITVDVTRGGQPAAGAGVTLYAVDYAVLSLTAYPTPDPFDTFYAHRGLSVIGADSRDRVLDRAHYLSKGGRAGGGGGMDFGSELRSDFVTTPLFVGDLRADDGGRATTRFQLPDNLTTFKIIAVVDHGADGFGSGEDEITVNRPLIVRPALPRFLRTGDRAKAGVVLHNNTDQQTEVTVLAEADGATLAGAPRTLTVKAHGAVEVPFAITDPVEGEAVFQFQATSEAGDVDAVITTLPVSVAQSREVVATSGSTTDRASETVGLPADALADRGGLELKLSPTVLVGLDAPVDYLLDYPHGCVEQVSSRTFAALTALDLYQQAGLAVTEEDLRATVAAGLDKLETFETSSGGLAYWPGARTPNPVGSGWALEILARAQGKGFAVDQQRIDRLVAFSRAFLGGEHVPEHWGQQTTWSAQARVALSLARAGHGDVGFNAALVQRADQMSAAGRANLLETLYRTPGSAPYAERVSNTLTAMVRIEPTGAALVDPQPDRWRSLWYSDDLATAAYLAAVVAAPAEQPLAAKLAKQVVQGRKRGSWHTTWSTSASLMALAEYAQRYEGSGGAVEVAATLAGEALLQETLTPPSTASHSVEMSALTPGELAMTAAGGRLYYEARMIYWRGVLPARDEGFTVRRSYRVLSGSGAAGAVTPGTLMEVTLEVVTPVARYDVAVVDPLPAGLESVDTGFATSGSGAEYSGYDDGYQDSGYWEDPEVIGGWVFNHVELRDDAVALFADRMPPGVYRYTYMARATTPGDYGHPPVHAEEMYAPEIFGRTEAGRFVVGSPVAEN